MTAGSATARPNPWAFWAPAADGLIEAALDLAGLRAGERFLDLGCGDGRVLVAAARRGASVRGIEIDPALADGARANLAAAGFTGEVEVGDMFTAAVDADVIYTYLTPVTLARLRPTLIRGRPDTRVVSPRYTIPGWRRQATHANCNLYRLPPEPEPPPVELGWPWRGVVLGMPVGRRCLVPLSLAGEAGQVRVELDGPLSRAAEAATGADVLDAPARVPVDLVFHAYGAGTAIAGSLTAGAHEMTIAAVFSPEGHGHWGFGPGEGKEFRATMDAKIAEARAGGNGAAK